MPELPFVSVVVPVFNGADAIGELLASLVNQDYPADRYEVIVVDNGSTDSTPQIVKNFHSVILLEEREIQGPAAARNRGISHARGEIIAFTDADCVADRNWLKMLVADHQDPTIGAFAGEIKGSEPALTMFEAVYNHNRFLSPLKWIKDVDSDQQKVIIKPRAPIQPRTRLEKLWVRLGLINYYQRRPPLPPMGVAPTANVAYRREVFEKIGLFDLGLLRGQDAEFSWRMQIESDYRFQPAPEAIIYHKHRTTVSEFLKQRSRYGLARILMLDKYIGLDADLRRQAVLESGLNIVFGLPYFLIVLGYRGIKSLVSGQPHSTYLLEPFVNWISDLGYNYGRIKACLDGVRVQQQRLPLAIDGAPPNLNGKPLT